MTGAAMVESEERREQRGVAPLRGKALPIQWQRLWLRLLSGFSPRALQRVSLRNIRPTDHVLEIGAGSGTANQNHFDLRGSGSSLRGRRPGRERAAESSLDEAYSCTADALPFPDESFDLAFHYYVADILRSRWHAIGRLLRVLKPGGLFVVSNAEPYWYPMLAAQVTPQWFHEFYVRHFGSGPN